MSRTSTRAETAWSSRPVSTIQNLMFKSMESFSIQTASLEDHRGFIQSTWKLKAQVLQSWMPKERLNSKDIRSKISYQGIGSLIAQRRVVLLSRFWELISTAIANTVLVILVNLEELKDSLTFWTNTLTELTRISLTNIPRRSNLQHSRWKGQLHMDLVTRCALNLMRLTRCQNDLWSQCHQWTNCQE